jgi:type III restriction enzyme
MPRPDNPILNSPFAPPGQHWQLDDAGIPTTIVHQGRRRSEYLVPIAQPRKASAQHSLDLEAEVTPNELINEIRGHVERWRALPAGSSLGVTHETRRLLDHWRGGHTKRRLFFCQIEAIETLIWLSEVAPRQRQHRPLLEQLRAANEDANPGLFRLAAKMATGSGKTTVMAMLIAWQAVNAARGRTNFADGILVICPGITIRDRLRVLIPSDPETEYERLGLVPDDLLGDVRKARVIVTNYHAFGLRQTATLSAYTKAALAGREAPPPTQETTGQMLHRVCKDLLGCRAVAVFNDEAHHCYQENPARAAERKLAAEEQEEARRNKEAARLWIGGIKALAAKKTVRTIYDLSATPFFLRGSGYPEGWLFPWVVSDFSLMDAVESGIVKIPRVPVSDNSLNKPMPVWRSVWAEIKDEMPKKGRAKQDLSTVRLPEKLLGALHGLYEHYVPFFDAWQSAFGRAGNPLPPVFIVVCQNTSHSKLLYDYIAGYETEETTPQGERRTVVVPGALDLFSNVTADGRRHPRPRTLLIDSSELDSGAALTPEFRRIAAPEIAAFKTDLIRRDGQGAADRISEDQLLREVMNTVGKEGRLGESIRCVVSVSMLTEGWDTNTVTHILGVRAFGTPLLCEQVVGRGLRRYSYDPDDNGMFEPQYAHVFGIPFSFAQERRGAETITPPKPATRVFAPRDRDAVTLTFPRVLGYRVRLPSDRLHWVWAEDSRFPLNPETAGPTEAEIADILGAGETITLDNYMHQRDSTVAFHVAGHALRTWFRDPDGNLKPYLFPQLLQATREWLATQLTCSGGAKPGLLLWTGLADQAAQRIYNACVRGGLAEPGADDSGTDDDAEAAARRSLLLPLLAPYDPEGSTRHVDFQTTKTKLWTTRADLCPVNYVVGDSEWEIDVCQVLESTPGVLAYVKNQGLGFEVPYTVGTAERRYRPDFIVRLDDGAGPDDPLNLVVEIKGFRRLDDDAKRGAMETHWIPAINAHGGFGRWAFVEISDIFQAKSVLGEMVGGSVAV